LILITHVTERKKSRPIRHKLIEAAFPYLKWPRIAATINPPDAQSSHIIQYIIATVVAV
jgi:hypothetical protein